MAKYAAIDVGSNSIRLLIADMREDGRIVQVHTDREVVRLGSSVFTEGRVSPAAMEAMCSVLVRMKAAIDSHDVDTLRVVGTSALRDASNQAEVVNRARSILCAPLVVISGTEEARLVDRGVRFHWPGVGDPALIVDVGGGSAQVILSTPSGVVDAASLPLGAVRLTEQFQTSDPLSTASFDAMKRHIRSTLAGRLDSMVECGVGRLVGTSATVGAVVCAANDVPRAERDGADRLRASRDQVSAVLETVASATIAERTKIVGVGRRRADVIVAGVAVIEAIMEALSLQSLHYSTAGVRDGIVAELAGENAAIVRRRRAERWLAFA